MPFFSASSSRVQRTESADLTENTAGRKRQQTAEGRLDEDGE